MIVHLYELSMNLRAILICQNVQTLLMHHSYANALFDTLREAIPSFLWRDTQRLNNVNIT